MTRSEGCSRTESFVEGRHSFSHDAGRGHPGRGSQSWNGAIRAPRNHPRHSGKHKIRKNILTILAKSGNKSHDTTHSRTA